MKKDKYNIAVAGATGMVGKEILSILEERKFPVGEMTLLASERSAGSTITFNRKKLTVKNIEEADFCGVDIGLFSPGASVSEIYAPKAAEAGAIVIDNTSRFRMEPDVPLVVPEVNPEAIAGYPQRNIIANPNCSTIQMVVALKPLHDRFHINRIVVSTYQAVSGAGKEAMDELSEQVRALFNMQTPETKIFPYTIAFNCLPQIDVFTENGYTKEEMKMIEETRKILGDDSIGISATAVRVPVFNCHSESINIETEEPATPDEVRAILSASPGVTVLDVPADESYPLALDITGKDDVFVGRIRRDVSVPNGIDMWVVSDNLRKGAALNAVQIAEKLIESYI